MFLVFTSSTSCSNNDHDIQTDRQMRQSAVKLYRHAACDFSRYELREFIRETSILAPLTLTEQCSDTFVQIKLFANEDTAIHSEAGTKQDGVI